MALNPPNQRYPFNVTGKCEPEVEAAIKNTFNGILDHEQAIAALAPRSGATTARPTTGILPGFAYFDTTLGMPVFFTGSGYVNATGQAV